MIWVYALFSMAVLGGKNAFSEVYCIMTATAAVDLSHIGFCWKPVFVETLMCDRLEPSSRFQTQILTQPLTSNLWFISYIFQLKTLYFKRQRDSLHELLTLTLLPTVAVSWVTYPKYLHRAKEIRQNQVMDWEHPAVGFSWAINSLVLTSAEQLRSKKSRWKSGKLPFLQLSTKMELMIVCKKA